MTIFCKLCGQKLNSSKPDDKAQEDVMIQMGNHLSAHQDIAVAFAKELLLINKLFATYLLIKKFVRIPPEETAFLKSYEDSHDCLDDIFDFDTEEPPDDAHHVPTTG